MTILEREFEERLDQGLEYHYSTSTADWILARMEDTGMYYVQKDAGRPQSFRRVEGAICHLLIAIGWWE